MQSPSGRPTLHTVAARAGVSIATVSHVLNGTRPTGADVRARVERAIAEVGYRPNAQARALRRRRSRILGLVVPDNSNPFFAEVARGVEDVCQERGYALFLSNSSGDPSREQRNAEALMAQQVEGLLLISSSAQPDYLERLARGGPPLVVVDRVVDGLPTDTVAVDNRAGARDAVRHLLSLGHRRIACVTGPRGLASSDERVAGYRAALHEAGVGDGSVVESDFTFEGGRQAFACLGQQAPESTAVFACNDLLALGVLAAARAAGTSVPAELSIVGFDDTLPSALVTPPLTTVAQPARELGKLAARRLFERLDGGAASAQPVHVTLPATLVVRGSTAAPVVKEEA